MRTIKSLVILLLIVVSVFSHATTITTTNPIMDPSGRLLNGKIIFYLPAPATDTSTNQVVTPIAGPYLINNGSLASSITLVGNDIMSPKMYYSANLYDSTGKWLSTYHYNITGATFDLGSAPMTPVTTSNINQTDWTVNNLTITGIINGLTVSKQVRDCTVMGPLGDGLVADGVTNDRVALNNCLANAYANGQNVQLPSGKIHISGGAINDTNKPGMNITGVQANETYSRDVATQDYGTGITQIMCDTGTVCWDMTGSGGQEIKHVALRIASSYSTPSTIGFLLGRDNAVSNGSSSGSGTYCFSANDVLNNVWVFADSIPAATALGTVAVYNMGAETFTILGGGYLANEGMMFGTSNVLSISSPFQTLGTGCPSSMTEVRINGANIEAWTGNSIRFDDQIIDFETDASTEFLNLSPGTNHNATINFNAPTFQNNIFLRGQVENFDFPVAISKNLDRAYINLMVGGNLTGHGLIQWATTNLSISNSNISFEFDNGTAVPLLDNVASGSSIKGSIINEAGLTGSGANASSTTVSTSTIYADGLTDAAVNTFQAGSSYDLFDASGRSYVGGVFRTPGNVARVTTDFTSANSAALQAITGLSFSLPAIAINYAFHCSILSSQATPSANDQFGVASLTTAPTLVTVNATAAQNITAGTTLNGNLLGLTTTTPTAFITYTPAIAGTLGATWDGVIEASGSGASTLQFYVLNGTAANVIVIKKDSFCTLIAQ